MAAKDMRTWNLVAFISKLRNVNIYSMLSKKK